MSQRAKLSPEAESDLDAIWLFIARDNLRAADRLVEQLVLKCRLLARSPRIGRQRDELRVGIRSLAHGRYLIFYRIDALGIQVVRVVGGEMDLPSLFPGE